MSHSDESWGTGRGVTLLGECLRWIISSIRRTVLRRGRYFLAFRLDFKTNDMFSGSLRPNLTSRLLRDDKFNNINPQNATYFYGDTYSNSLSYLDAVKICLELVHMALMGLSWPLTSPMGVKLSTFHTFSMPPRQALSSMGRPGTYASAHTQSLWALGICCRVGTESDMTSHGRL